MQRWVRPHHVPTARAMRIELVALLDGNAHVDAALGRARDELAADRAWDALEIDVRARATDVGRLDRLLDGRAGLALADRDEADRLAAARCQRYVTVEAAPPDAADLAPLQAAAALLRALAVEEDLALAWDAGAARWWAPAELAALAPARPFALDEHVRVVVEAVERRPGAGHLVRSRGLAKLARPDVGARVPRPRAAAVAELVRDVARLFADGAAPLPGDRLNAPGLPPLTLIPRTDDALADAAPDDAPLYELRDAVPRGAGDSLARLLAALR